MPKGIPKRNGPFIVYVATNAVNGKQYIGVTAKDKFKKRQYTHLRDARTGRMTSRIFHRALLKYGKDVFKWSVLVETETRTDVLLEEIRLIATLKPAYNIARGGQGGGGYAKSLESLEAISRPVTCLTDGKAYRSGADACRTYGISGGRLSIICRHGGATKGLRFKFSDSDEDPPIQRYRTKEEVERYRRGVEAGRQKAIDKCRLPVVCLDTGEKFGSVVEATNKFGFKSSVLYSALMRGHKCHGYKFEFVDNVNDVQSRIYIRDPLSSASHGAQRVICVSDNMLFDSVADAAKFYAIGRKEIDRHLKGRRKSKDVYGKNFSYLNEWCVNPL